MIGEALGAMAVLAERGLVGHEPKPDISKVFPMIVVTPTSTEIIEFCKQPIPENWNVDS